MPLRSGVIAQLVERLNGIEEVWGSNPHGSTPRLPKNKKARSSRAFCLLILRTNRLASQPEAQP